MSSSFPRSAAWSPTPVRGEVTALATHGLRVAAALHSRGVLVSLDGGLGWELAKPLSDGATVTALLWLPQGLLAGTAGRGLLRVEAGAWEADRAEHLPGRTVLALAQRGGVVLAGTLRSGVFRSTDGGRSWSAASAGLPLLGDGLEVSQLVALRRAWYVLHPFGVSESLDGGRSWHLVVSGLPSHRWPSTLAGAGGILHAEVGAHLYRLATTGRWTAGSVGPIRLVGRAGPVLFAVLPDGLGCSADGGRTWSGVQQGLPTEQPVMAVGSTRNTVLAVLDGSGLWSRPHPDGPEISLGAVRPREIEVTLQTNRPNPFSDTTAIPFTLSAASDIVLTVHDVADVEVGRLAEGTYAAGEHRVMFEASTLPSGIYRYRLFAGGRSHDRSMLLIKR